jgi:hypothetical protein
MAANSRTQPKRAVVKPWPFGFRVSEGHLKLDVGGGDPPAVTFVNRTDFQVQFHFDTPFLVDPARGGPLRVLSLDRGQLPVTCNLIEDAEGWYEYQARVMVSSGEGLGYIEASAGSRPDVDVQR